MATPSTPSILSTLGLGAPSPAAYSDASAVATQKAQVVTGLQGTLAAISTALMGAKTMGFPAAQIDSLRQHVADGTALLGQAATMGPAALQVKVSELESKFASSQFNITQNNYNSRVASLEKILITVQEQVTAVRTDTISVELLSKYETLLIDTQTALTTLKASPPIYRNPSDSGSGSSAYIIPTVLSANDIQDRLNALNDQKDEEAGSGTNIKRWYENFTRWLSRHFIKYFIYITIFASMILGGIITSNLYLEVESGAVLSRIFYFIYGAIFYPVALIYSCIPGTPSNILNPLTAWPGKTPYWSAGLIPLYQRIPVITIPAPLTTDAIEETGEPQTGGNILDIFSAAKSAVTQATVQASVAVGDIKKSVNGAQTFDKESVIKNRDGTIKMSNEIQPNTIPARLLSFVIVDSKNPAPYQVANRTNLLYLSVAALIGNILISMGYGFL